MVGTGIVSAAFIDMIGTGTAYAGKRSYFRRHSALIEAVGWLIAGCWAFYVLYTVRDGAWRIYDPFAQLSGILLYASYFHKPIRFFGRILLLLVVKPLWFIVMAIFTVVRQIIRLTHKILSFFYTPFVSLFHKQYRKLFPYREK